MREGWKAAFRLEARFIPSLLAPLAEPRCHPHHPPPHDHRRNADDHKAGLIATPGLEPQNRGRQPNQGHQNGQAPAAGNFLRERLPDRPAHRGCRTGHHAGKKEQYDHNDEYQQYFRESGQSNLPLHLSAQCPSINGSFWFLARPERVFPLRGILSRSTGLPV